MWHLCAGDLEDRNRLPAATSLTAWVHGIFAFASQLGLRDITLVGHSYGGTEAIRAAQLFPQLFRRMILLDTANDTIPPGAPAAEAELFAAFTGMSTSDRLSPLENDRAWEKRLLRCMVERR